MTLFLIKNDFKPLKASKQNNEKNIASFANSSYHKTPELVCNHFFHNLFLLAANTFQQARLKVTSAKSEIDKTSCIHTTFCL